MQGRSRDDALPCAVRWLRSSRRSRAGVTLGFELATVGSGDNAAEQLIQADLGARGFDVRIRQVELAAFLTMARATPKTFDALITGIPGDLSLSFLGAMYGADQTGGSLDYSGFHTRALDSLLRVARTAGVDTSARLPWHAVQKELQAELPAVWLYHARGLQGLSRRLQGVRMDLRGELATITRWSVSGRQAALTN